MVMDTKNHGRAIMALLPKDYATTAPVSATESLVVDTRGFEYIAYVNIVGTVAGTGAACKLQSSTTSGGTYADITGATFTTLTTSNDVAAHVVIVHTSKCDRFVKAAWTFTAMTAAPLAGVAYLLSCKDTSQFLGTEVDAIVG